MAYPCNITQFIDAIRRQAILGILENSIKNIWPDLLARLNSLREQASENKNLPTDYQKYMKSEEWKIRRKAILDYYQNRCEICQCRFGELHVHHRAYECFGEEADYDLVVLCFRCHAYVPPCGMLARRWLKEDSLYNTFENLNSVLCLIELQIPILFDSIISKVLPEFIQDNDIKKITGAIFQEQSGEK